MAIIYGQTQWQFGERLVLGSSFGGGLLICKSGGVAWIVSPSSTQVTRTWHCRNDAVTTAQSITGCTGWFVPTCGQLQNPGYTCRTYWDSYSCVFYYSSTEYNANCAWSVSMVNGSASCSSEGATKVGAKPVRAFRCVTY